MTHCIPRINTSKPLQAYTKEDPGRPTSLLAWGGGGFKYLLAGGLGDVSVHSTVTMLSLDVSVHSTVTNAKLRCFCTQYCDQC